MSKYLKSALAKSIALTVCLFAPLGSYCQPSINRVVSVVEDASGQFLVVNTSLQKTLPPPAIQYFPGADGETTMVADFYGLLWTRPYCIINPRTVDGKLKQIRCGQFQEFPPIFRMSVTTNDPTSLRQLRFKTTPGILIVKWPSTPQPKIASSKAATPTANLEPAAVPIFAIHRQIPKTTAVDQKDMRSKVMPLLQAKQMVQAKQADVRMPAPLIAESKEPPKIAPTFVPKATEDPDTTIAPAPPLGQLHKALPLKTSEAPKTAPEIASPTGKKSQYTNEVPYAPLSFNPVSYKARKLLFTPVSRLANATAETNQENPIEATIADNSATIKIHPSHPITYRAFRLHDPERYVVDIDGMPELLSAQPPNLETNPYISGIRLGSPATGSNENTSRMVIELGNADVQVKEKLADDSSIFTLTAAPQIGMLDGLEVLGKATVVLDAGHGGSDPGAQRASIQEKELTLAITDKLKDLLSQKGIKVEMTRTDDTFVSLEDRVKITNATKPDAFVSVHINSLETSSNIGGIETYYQTEQSKGLADALQKSLTVGLQVPDRLVRKARFYVINHTEVPAVLAEVGYITNVQEREKLNSSDYQGQVAEALARGVILYLNKHYQASSLPDKGGRAN